MYSHDATGFAIRGAELGGGVKFRLPVSNFSREGFDTVEISGCCEKTLSRECSVSCFVYAMERGTERTTTVLGRAVLSMDEQMVCV